MFEPMKFTGERFTPETHGNIELEHLHRYLQAVELAADKVVLDIASGEGYGSAMLANRARKVIGVDISIEAIKHARNRYKKENLEYMVGNCAEIPLSDASVDMVVSFETIEHLDQHEQLMQEIKRVLRPTGILLISSPDKYHYSVEPGYSNSFHIKELYEHEFKQLLGRYFKNVAYFEQRIIYGSCIFAESLLTQSSSYWQENETIKKAPGLIKPVYWIALASDVRLPEFASSVFEQPINESEIVKSWNGVVAERDGQITNLNQGIAERDRQIISLNQGIAERDGQIASLSQGIAKWDRHITNLNQGINIAQIGAFDVENYGDLLFPIIFEHEIKKRLNIRSIILFSPVGSSRPFDGKAVYPIRLLEQIHLQIGFDAIVIGGGDIIRLDDNVANDAKYPVRGKVADLWALPILIAQKYNIPVLFNAPGVPFAFLETQKKFVTELLRNVQYVSVRDEISKKFLREAGYNKDVRVIPDTIMLVRNCYSDEMLSNIFETVKQRNQLPEKYFVFQTGTIDSIAANTQALVNLIDTLQERFQCPAVLMPIGYVHDDTAVLNNINLSANKKYQIIQDKLSPAEMLSVISQAKFFVGTSLHGNITAHAFDVPAIALNPGLTKLVGYYLLVGLESYIFSNVDDCLRLSVAPVSIPVEKKQTLLTRIEQHFDRMANLLSSEVNKAVPDSSFTELSVLLIQWLAREWEAEVSRRNYFAIVYFAGESDFSEINKLILPWNPQEVIQQWTLQLPEGTRQIRFDPVEGVCCIVKDLTISIGSYKLTPTPLNGIIVGDYVAFSINDPQFLIKMPEEIQEKLKISCSILPLKKQENSMLDDFFLKFISITDEKNTLLLEIQNQFEETKKHLTEARAQLAQAQVQLMGTLTQFRETQAQLAERDGQIVNLNQGIAERDGQISRLREREAQLQEQTNALLSSAQEAGAQIASLKAQLATMYGSHSWRITSPMRAVGSKLRWMRERGRVARTIIRFALSKGLRAGYRLFRERRLVLSSGAFDCDYYRSQYPDVVAAQVDPALHYLLHGASEGRDPNPLLDTDWYLQQYPDVSEAGINPLVHYLRFGMKEGRLLRKAEGAQIVSLNQAVAEHSLNQGIAERDGQIAAILNSTSWRVTRPLRWVGDQLRHVRMSVVRFLPRALLFTPKWFDAQWYLKQNPDVAMSGMDPYKHYILFGKKEGRRPVPDESLLQGGKSGVYHLLRIAPQIIAQKGGIWRTGAAAIRVYRQEGFTGIKHRIKRLKTGSRSNHMHIETSLNPTVSLLKSFKEEAFSIPDDATLSVIIPTLNAGKYFSTLLPMLKNQKGFKQLEIVVVDSGSTDETLELASEYDAKIVEIPPEKFSHSYSRNLGAEKATGNYLFFTVQDAFPPSEVFLRECLNVFKTNDVVAVSCAEFPREDVDLFYRVACWNHYEFLGVNNGDRILSKPTFENHITLRQNGQLSDIACFIPRELFMKYTYRYDYAEDLDLGVRLIRDGHKIAFLSSLKIIHSHNRPPFYYLKRGYADQIFLTKIFPDYPKLSIKAERIADEIFLAYGVLNHLVADDLTRIAIPCRTKEFIIAVSDSFASTMKKSITRNLPHVSPYIDEEFSTFLKTVRVHAHSLDKIGNGHSLELLQGVVNFLKEASFPYLTNSTEIIDEQMHQEFKAHLYKIFALLCGVNIANSYVACPDNVDGVLSEIRAGLVGGV